MTHSMYNVDRTTHLKIVVVALVAAIGISVGGISMRLTSDDFQMSQTAPVLKAGAPVMVTTSDTRIIR